VSRQSEHDLGRLGADELLQHTKLMVAPSRRTPFADHAQRPQLVTRDQNLRAVTVEDRPTQLASLRAPSGG
jgi:hypothetical protein